MSWRMEYLPVFWVPVLNERRHRGLLVNNQNREAERHAFFSKITAGREKTAKKNGRRSWDKEENPSRKSLTDWDSWGVFFAAPWVDASRPRT